MVGDVRRRGRAVERRPARMLVAEEMEMNSVEVNDGVAGRMAGSQYEPGSPAAQAKGAQVA